MGRTEFVCHPGVGLRADLRVFHDLRFDHGTESFLDIPNQNVLRSGDLARFLAHATDRPGDRSVMFDHVVGGRDILHSSLSLAGSSLPTSELAAFHLAIEGLLALAQSSPSTKSREMLGAFRLPSPSTDPDFYRLVGGRGGPRRLVVLWGCERTAGSSLMPLDAVGQLQARVKPPWRVGLERSLWLIPLLLLALIAWKLLHGPEAETPAPTPIALNQTGTNSSLDPVAKREALLPNVEPPQATQPPLTPPDPDAMTPTGTSPNPTPAITPASTPTRPAPGPGPGPGPGAINPSGSTPAPSPGPSPGPSTKAPTTSVKPTGGDEQLEVIFEPNPADDGRSVFLDARLKGGASSLSVDSWSIDGVDQKASRPRILATLAPGTHQVEVRGTSGGRSYRREVELVVDTSTSYLIKPKPKPSPAPKPNARP